MQSFDISVLFYVYNVHKISLSLVIIINMSVGVVAYVSPDITNIQCRCFQVLCLQGGPVIMFVNVLYRTPANHVLDPKAPCLNVATMRFKNSVKSLTMYDSNQSQLTKSFLRALANPVELPGEVIAD